MRIKKFVRYIDTLSLLAYSRLVCITQRLEYNVTYLVVSWEFWFIEDKSMSNCRHHFFKKGVGWVPSDETIYWELNNEIKEKKLVVNISGANWVKIYFFMTISLVKMHLMSTSRWNKVSQQMKKKKKKTTYPRDGTMDISMRPVDPKTQNMIELSQQNRDTQRALSLAPIQGLQAEHK